MQEHLIAVGLQEQPSLAPPFRTLSGSECIVIHLSVVVIHIAGVLRVSSNFVCRWSFSGNQASSASRKAIQSGVLVFNAAAKAPVKLPGVIVVPDWMVYVLVLRWTPSEVVAAGSSLATTLVLRLAAIRWKLELPLFHVRR